MRGRGVLVGVNVGAGVEVACDVVAVGVRGVDVSVGAQVTVSIAGAEVGQVVGVGLFVKLSIPHPTAARQPVSARPVVATAKTRRAPAFQSVGDGT